MLPSEVAIVSSCDVCPEPVALYLRSSGVRVSDYSGGDRLLAGDAPFAHEFYVVSSPTAGVDAIDLVRILRLRTHAGILVLASDAAPSEFENALSAGADMLVTRPTLGRVVAAIRAIQRRVARVPDLPRAWQLDSEARHLVSPKGCVVRLTRSDSEILACFPPAAGAVVTQQAICVRLGLPFPQSTANNLQARIYRMRRRIERAMGVVLPLRSRPCVGYEFKDPICFTADTDFTAGDRLVVANNEPGAPAPSDGGLSLASKVPMAAS